MKRIFKYPLKVVDDQRIRMPKGAKILCIQTQNETPCLWAEVDDTAGLEYRAIEIFGTGQPMGEDMGTSREYVGTFQIAGGSLIFHVYEAGQ